MCNRPGVGSPGRVGDLLSTHLAGPPDVPSDGERQRSDRPGCLAYPRGCGPIPAENAAVVSPSSGGAPEMAVRLGKMRRRLGLATLLLVLFLTFMDNTVISVTLANVQSTLHTGISQLQWVINGYALVFASFMLLFGTLGDQLGRKKVMLSGVVLFCGGSVLGGIGFERRHAHRGQGGHGSWCRGLRAWEPSR